MSTYYDLIVELKNCKTEKQLMEVAEYIDTNKKTLGLDDYHLEKLQAVGMQKYERMVMERNMMVKNRKN